MALDLETEEAVETPRPEVAATSYSTPVLWRQEGREEIVIAGATSW
jgi:hypothetical protein